MNMELAAAHLHLLRWRSYSILLLSVLLAMMIPMATYATQRQQLSTSPSSSSVSQQRKLEVQNHLKRLNKPPLKSIRSPDGDIIDCVHMSQQPAFDHPLLKNHKLQVRPNLHPDNNNGKKGSGLFGFSKMSSNKKQVDDEVSSSSKGSVEMAGEADDNKNTTTSGHNYNKKVVQLWHLKGRCPKGTIPIRRTKNEDILRASTVQAFGKKKQRTVPRPKSAQPDLLTQSGHQHAIVYVEGDKYYGAKATMNVWEPQIQQPNEFSLSQIWILGGSFGQDLNSIEAGWQVSPDLYGDNRTRLFTYWTSDAYQATGCYNLLCSGFIQINNEIAMGASIYPLSAYQTSQYDITLLVWKDPKEGNWWVQFGNEYVLGYWPAMLFSYLSDSASMIEWGGEIVNSESDGQHTTTQMGSGHFPREGFGKAAYFKNIQIVDGSNNLRPPKGISIFTEQSDCYDVRTANSDADNWGNYFFYGGPGRNTNCP